MAWLTATYLITSTPGAIRDRAQALALEQSVELPLAAVHSKAVRDSIVARVASIDRDPRSSERFRVALQLAVATTGDEVTQLLNMLFGNCSLQGDVELEDVEVPEGFLRCFGGPRFGIAGIRELAGAYHRPLTCRALKPQGSSPAELAALCETFARAGIDIVKDDHGLADQRYAP
ncbi:MAG: ribulose 1,5-bisphosphate carboxylase, partial [Candidatus Eremiobacteraeota bacterium]|nr:ribulose 1,5-bisphosphate carboxylase [Candidatus Eremiobacteraeota bacterium]